jgi:pyruvate-ferredoxin/flavodoxin oxidoreductase
MGFRNTEHFLFRQRCQGRDAIPVNRPMVTIDGNEAAAYVAHRTNEVIAIYPITPSSAMGEWADEWSAKGTPNIWGSVPQVIEMQSEGGAAGALHGALQAGALGTTFTASQGLLLMIPNMFKIAGELTSTVMHVSARTVASHALSIFGDHSDVMACRGTGWAMVCSGSVQEVMDMALICQAATLEARVPILHFFDGFRTSHEIAKVEKLRLDDLKAMLPEEAIHALRARALTPDRPVLRGTAQNPDVFFQSRERVNPYYARFPQALQAQMDRFAAIVGRQYRLFDYVGAADAEHVLVLMGSGAEVAQEYLEYANSRGAKLGLLKVRMFRPWSVEHFLASLPPTVRRLAVLDRTKEPGAAGEPLYADVLTALTEGHMAGTNPLAVLPKVIGGRYGLSSKEFTPAMVKAVYDELAKPAPKNHFTVGISDDVSFTSLDYDPNFSTEDEATHRANFYGLGSDGTVGANKNSIKIIGEDTDSCAQGYFVYDSKKSGAMTVSHLRFGPRPIRSSYLIRQAQFVACHQFSFVGKIDMLSGLQPGGTFLLNCPLPTEQVWDALPAQVQKQLIDRRANFYVIDAYAVAKEAGMGLRINTIMQTCFFAISGVLPREEAISAIKRAIERTYGKRGRLVVVKNFAAVDAALAHLHQITVPEAVSNSPTERSIVPPHAPAFVREVTARMIAGEGDELPVSAFPEDGSYPTGTSQWEKRNIALEIPVWDESLCIQCGKCVLVCPHAVIRSKLYDPALLSDAPENFKSADAKWKDYKDQKYTLQVSPEDCTGCALCVEACPVKDKREVKRRAINMAPQAPLRAQEGRNWNFFLSLPEFDRNKLNPRLVKDVQIFQPLFEFSGACSGCGETPYIKLLTQLFGDRALIANATGCSSIYGGNLPTTPYTKNPEGRGPAWSNSLFEDNAEFGLGIRLAIDQQTAYATELLDRMRHLIGDELVTETLCADQTTEAGIQAQRERVARIREHLAGVNTPEARDLRAILDNLVKRSVWIVGGDGWAYDIGYGGLDHVIASGRNVNILVLDTEVYSNTGGQCSKSTPRGAVAKFAAGGKVAGKKDLGLMAMDYGTVYVAHVAMGASDSQTVKAFMEAEAYEGPSLIIAYSHCIAHGYDLVHGLSQQKLAVDSGYWPLYRYNPALAEVGRNPLQLDSRDPKVPLRQYVENETRFTVLMRQNPQMAEHLLEGTQRDIEDRWTLYKHLASMEYGVPVEDGTAIDTSAASAKAEG